MRQILCVLSGTLLGSFLLAWNPTIAQAADSVLPDQEVLRIATRTNWQGASFPVEGFQGYTSLFGWRRFTSNGPREFHSGLDMGAPMRSYIRSWMPGRVIAVSQDARCGTSVKVQSGNWTHIYCHMEGQVMQSARGRYLTDRQGGLQIWEGQQVRSGAVLGRVGMTGRTMGPHLHWGLRYNGQWVNPGLVLETMYNQQRFSFRPSGNPS